MVDQAIITLVFADIEHSTRLAQQLRHDYPTLLVRYRAVIREALHIHGGREIDTAGDGFFMVFDIPQNAVCAIKRMQQQFHSQPWAVDVELKVRMGIHTGLALATPSGYTGVEVHRASRICSAAHGGQVLISNTTQEHLEDLKNIDCSLKKIGVHNFEDFQQPVTLFQLNIPGLNQSYPDPRIELSDQKIAVMPFRMSAKDQSYDHVGEGLAEELIIALGKVKGLRVASRSSSFAITNNELGPKEIGKKLDVHSLVAGHVKMNNGTLQIAVELVDTNSGLNIWSDLYKVDRKDIIQMQDKIAQKITNALEFELVPEQQNSIQVRQTQNAEAYDFYLRGRRFYLQFSNRGIDLALKMFQKAIDSDPEYALAYAGLADCYSYQYLHKAKNQPILQMADEASKRAIELDPLLAETLVSRGVVYTLNQHFDEAEKSFQNAIERDPTLFWGWYHYARSCFASGQLDKAARLFEQANKVEPEDYQSILLAAQSYNDVGSPDLSRTFRQKGVDIAYRWIELNPGDTRALYMAANALVFLDQPEKSLALLQQALSLEPEDSMLLYNAGCIYSLLSMKKEALSCVEKAYEHGLTMQGWYANDSNLDNIRDEPRFKALLEKLKVE